MLRSVLRDAKRHLPTATSIRQAARAATMHEHSAAFPTTGGSPMTIKVGDRMPAGTFKTMTKDGPQNITTDQLFAGKKVVLFSVPGAFTPTCDAKHLPGFVERASELRGKGVDTVACMAVNDVFVMNAWGKHSNVGDKVLMLADGNGDYAKALGLELNATGFGMGMRGQRFAIVVDDGVVKKVNVEAPTAAPSLSASA
jgi:peroxiredoxin